MIAFDEPGTTRDAIDLDFERDGKHYTLIDTAGVRRARQGVRGGREVLGGEDAAGDRGRERRDPAARRAPTTSPSRTRTSRATSSRRAARWSSASTSGTRADARQRDEREERPRAQARASSTSPQHHYISAREGTRHRRADDVGRRGVRRGDGEAVDAASSRARCRRRSSASSRRAPAWCARRCATPTRAAHNPPHRRSSTASALHARARRPTGATWNISSATRSNCGARRLGYNSRRVSTPTRTTTARR